MRSVQQDQMKESGKFFLPSFIKNAGNALHFFLHRIVHIS